MVFVLLLLLLLRGLIHFLIITKTNCWLIYFRLVILLIDIVIGSIFIIYSFTTIPTLTLLLSRFHSLSKFPNLWLNILMNTSPTFRTINWGLIFIMCYFVILLQIQFTCAWFLDVLLLLLTRNKNLALAYWKGNCVLVSEIRGIIVSTIKHLIVSLFT